ncbi:hypothetical protein SERLA73DRAFT_187821 [Serpula lacrymans var. lacrymans S7.3]|uniref:Uncharacterized protein n=1 Tax=Serpula lacrymans var. lacrymans (strain S7.3) TaxID=936435 RepID=F8QAI2_SERL3|nr:hypothetical protein SERLA73DRAFT_187821 [Serpula lacrymans var. lacrymans S7.3]
MTIPSCCPVAQTRTGDQNTIPTSSRYTPFLLWTTYIGKSMSVALYVRGNARSLDVS